MTGIINFFKQIGAFISGFLSSIALLFETLNTGLLSVNGIISAVVPSVCLGVVLLIITVFVLGIVIDLLRDIF